MMKKRPTLTVFVVILVLITGLVAVFIFTIGKPVTFPPLPNPNGYDDFMKAGGLLGSEVAEAYEMDAARLRALTAANAESLRLFELGMSRDCSVHTAEVIANASGWSGDLIATKKLAQFVAAQGRLAELEQRTNDAAQIYANGIDYGCKVGHGGLLIHHLVAIACQAIADTGLERLISNTPFELNRELIERLKRVDQVSPSWDEVMRNESHFVRREISQNIWSLEWIPAWWSNRAAVRKARLRHNLIVARRRLLMTELSLRCAFKETGQVPDSLEDLSPRYLDDLPIDPFSNVPLKYRPAGTNWLLYSVGPDGRDDRGARLTGTATNPKTRGDIYLDTQ